MTGGKADGIGIVHGLGLGRRPAAKAEAMYDPDTIGLSASQLIVTLPMDE